MAKGKRFPSLRCGRQPWALLVAVCILALAAMTSAATVTRFVTFTEGDLSCSKRDGYDLVSLEGARWLNRPGEPHVPLVPVRVVLPDCSRIEGFAVTALDSLVLAGEFLLWPSQPPQSLSPVRPVEFVEPQAAVYTSGRMYPECAGELVGWGRLRGATVCDILVYPLRYVPAERHLVLYRSLMVEVTYSSAGPAGQPGLETSEQDLEMLRGLVSADDQMWEIVKHKGSDVAAIPLGGETVDYLIITRDSLASYFEPLKQWKTRKGLRTRIVTVEDASITYAGMDVQEKIRNCIRYFHVNAGTDWVLLGGDVDVLPDRKAYVAISDRPYLPCDLYYADLDGTWNADGDLYWGEVPSDDLDMYADVFLGRAPVSNGTEAQIFVNKVLTYEGCYGLADDYQLDMLFAGEVLWGDPGNPSSPDYTDAGVAKDLIDSSYVPAGFDVRKLYESQGNLDHATFMDELAEGRNIINVLCHGQYKSISIGDDNVSDADFSSLANGPRYGLLYSASCYSGGFDQNDCIGEAWVLSPEGGGFFIGNSRYGWNCPGFPGEGPSDYYDQSFFESVFITGFTNLGKAHTDAKHEFVAESRADPYMRYIMYGLNLLGDPEMRLWIGKPESLEVTLEDSIEIGPKVFEVHVAADGTPVSNAEVCLFKGDEVYVVGMTDGAGLASMAIEPMTGGEMLVTVTGADLIPFLGEARVVEDRPPAAPQDLTAEERIGPCVRLEWAGVDDGDLACYRVYRNTSEFPQFLASVPAGETAYVDYEVVEGMTYYYWVAARDTSGIESDLSGACSVTVQGIIAIPDADPYEDTGLKVRPNPFRSTVSFEFAASAGPEPRIEIFDVHGRSVGVVRPVRFANGKWCGHWDTREASDKDLPPGIYLVRFGSGRDSETRKVIRLK